jgi:1-acyl-sn-glycerol-3-phosphate acyltransferases
MHDIAASAPQSGKIRPMLFTRYFTVCCVRPLRVLAFLAMITGGLATLAFVFPMLGQKQRGNITRRWSKRMLRTLGIRLHVTGTPPSGAALLVANHVSWADPFVLIACYPVHFVAKAEIRRWPVFGWLAAQAGTIFIKRERQRDLADVARAFVSHLTDGSAVGMFPESTTSDGTKLLPFKPGLFQVAVSTAADCYPVALSYDRRAAIWVDDMGFLSSLWQVMAQPRITASVSFCPAIRYQGQHRRDLAVASEAAIANALSLPAPRIPPETLGDLQDAAQ